MVPAAFTFSLPLVGGISYQCSIQPIYIIICWISLPWTNIINKIGQNRVFGKICYQIPFQLSTRIKLKVPIFTICQTVNHAREEKHIKYTKRLSENILLTFIIINKVKFQIQKETDGSWDKVKVWLIILPFTISLIPLI